MDRLRKLWRYWSTPQGAVWLPVLPPAGAFAELAVLFGIIHLVNFIAPDIDVLNLEPSPYWLPILLLSLQYGTVAGLLAAGAATLAYVMSGLPEQNIDEHHFAYLLRVWSLPILWIGVALVLGQFRLRQIELKQQLQTGLDQRTKEAQALTVYVRDLEHRFRELERLITSRAGQAGGTGVLDALATLSAPGIDLKGFVKELCGAAFPRSKLSVFALQATALEPAFAIGASADAARRLSSDHSLYKAVVTERSAVSVLDAAGEKALAGEGLAAVPIIQEDTGRVLGMLKLEQATGDILTKGITTQLAVAASLIAPMMGELRVVVDNTAERVSGPIDAPRTLRKRRHFSWHHTDAPAAGTPSPADPGRSGSRPRVQK